MARITSFRELEAFQIAFDLAMEIYRLSRSFPTDERFGLVAQILRSSRSVCANIGEAWRRRRYPAAFIAKLTDAEAEAAETRIHLDLALACGYVDAGLHADLDRRYDELVGKLVRMVASADAWAVGRSGRRQTRGGLPCGVTRTANNPGSGREYARTPLPRLPCRRVPEGRNCPGNVM